MSFILCTESSCMYQENGQCNLNNISNFYYQKRTSSTCIYYQEKEIVDKYILSNSKNQEQTS